MRTEDRFRRGPVAATYKPTVECPFIQSAGTQRTALRSAGHGYYDESRAHLGLGAAARTGHAATFAASAACRASAR